MPLVRGRLLLIGLLLAALLSRRKTAVPYPDSTWTWSRATSGTWCGFSPRSAV